MKEIMFKLALSNLKRRKMRSAISIMALSVGICLYIMLYGLVDGVLHEFKNPPKKLLAAGSLLNVAVKFPKIFLRCEGTTY